MGTRKPVELYTSHFNPVSRAVLTLHSSPSMQAEVLFFPKLCRNSPPNFGGNQNLETKHGWKQPSKSAASESALLNDTDIFLE